MRQPTGAVLGGRATAGPGLLHQLGWSLDELNHRCSSQLTQRRLWQQTWLDLNPGADIWAVYVAEGARLDAALVLHDTAGPGGEPVVQALCPRGNDRLVPAAATDEAGRELAATLAQTLLSRRAPWALSLGPVPLGNPFLEQLHAHLPHSTLTRGASIPMVDPAPGHDCTAGAGCPGVSANMQRNLRKARNRLAHDDRVARIHHTNDWREIHSWLERAWQLRCDRDAFVGRPHPDPDRRLKRFWINSLRAHAQLGLVELSRLDIDGQLAAYVIGTPDGGAYRVLEGRFNTTLGRYNPGRLLEAEVTRKTVCHNGLHLDWMNAVAPEKLVAATSVQDTQWLHASS